MPADQTYDNVAVELNYTQLGRVIGNSLVGSRIGFSMQSGSGCVHIGNTSKSVTNYAHEIQNCEWCVVEGNSSTGTTGSICGAVMSGTATSNKIVNNQFSLYPTPVSDVSTWAAGYPSTISSNG
jgi:nitrous oxidase accessory protein NosD